MVKPLESIWTKFDRLFAHFDDVMDSVFKSDGTTEYTSDGITITDRGGHVEIVGDLKSLKINGRLVRFIQKEK